MNTDRPSQPTHAAYLAHLLADAGRLADLLDNEPLDTPIPTCPGWDLIKLGEHVGSVHRWAYVCVVNCRPPTDEESQAANQLDRSDPGGWIRSGAERLATALTASGSDAPTWHPFPGDQVSGFWARRQAHETVVHRWDAERGCGKSTPIDPTLASDGIDEYFEVVVPRRTRHDSAVLPEGSLHLHCTDVHGEWLLTSGDEGYQLIRAHQKGDAALRGPAAAMLLRLWGRDSADADQLSPIGDESVLDAWLAIGGP